MIILTRNYVLLIQWIFLSRNPAKSLTNKSQSKDDNQNYFFSQNYSALCDGSTICCYCFQKYKNYLPSTSEVFPLDTTFYIKYTKEIPKNTKEMLCECIFHFLPRKTIVETFWDVGLHYWGLNASFDTNIDIQYDCHMTYVISPFLLFMSY